MPPWKIDKKGWRLAARTSATALAARFSFVEKLINFCNIRVLEGRDWELAMSMAKKTQPGATWGRRNLGVDLDLALT